MRMVAPYLRAKHMSMAIENSILARRRILQSVLGLPVLITFSGCGDASQREGTQNLVDLDRELGEQLRGAKYDLPPRNTLDRSCSEFEHAYNENASGPSPLGLRAIFDNLKYSHRYSPTSIHEANLVHHLSKFHQVTSDFLVMHAGGTSMLAELLSDTVSKERSLVMSHPEFHWMSRFARSQGADLSLVPVDQEGSIDLSKILKKQAKAGLIYISNPHNPLGRFIQIDQMEPFLSSISHNLPILIDEAYIGYLGEDHASQQTVINLTSKYKNLMVLRTFSKVHGLAGLRVAYSVSHPDFRKRFSVRAPSPFTLSSLSLAAATAALNDQNHVKKTVSENLENKQKFEEFARQNSVSFITKSVANFLAINLPVENKKLVKYFNSKKKVLGNWDGVDFVRMSIGSKQSQKIFQDDLSTYLESMR